MDPVLKGDFSRQLPRQDTNLVRIFLSSTFGDFIEERNKLAQETFPRLQKYCQLLGLEFQVVDMRWGVRDENISYHQTSDVCIQEIHNCQRLSIGPSFVALIGNRYGYRPFPGQIPDAEFQLFLELGSSQGIDTTILSKWYKADMNTITQEFQLLPITSHYPNYSSKDKTLMALDRDGWWKTFLELQKTFWALVRCAIAQGHMTAERAHIYLQSVTEDEINHGIFRHSSPNDSCLCYMRTLANLEESLTDDAASKYIDISPDSSTTCVDAEAQRLLHELKFQKLPAALGPDNVHSYNIPWMPGGISDRVDEHKKYLDKLCTQIFHDIKSLIDGALESKRNLQKSSLHTEVLHHASLCLSKAKSYCDRGDDIISKIEVFATGSIRKPLIVYGKSGSGKTSVIAKVVHSLRLWSKETGCVVVRFFGTSPLSSTLREALISICEQICSLYDIPHPKFNEMDALAIIQYFRDKLMNTLDTVLTETLYLVLDSVDQLSASDGAHSMKWLPLITPPRVKIIVSLLSEGYSCLKCVQSLLPFSEANYIEVGVMSIGAGLHIMSKWLSDIGRTISQEQQTLISKAFLCCPQPLFLKLLFGRARTWKSYTHMKSIGTIPKSTQEALNDFYKNLEEYFGKVLVEKALGYLTASREGITESELEHVLSLDNEVLNDVYQYWDPPIRGVVRIPSLLWKRIHHFIADYIVEQLSGGVTVMVWYHRQFIESALARYVNENTKASLHSTLAEYFDGLFANGVGRSVRLSHRGLDLVNADRQVPPQPLTFGEDAYNLRKLTELPLHLLYSNQLDSLKTTVLCNFTWMQTQLRASGYSKLMRDYITTLRIHQDESDISSVSETLSLSHSTLQVNPDMLAGQLVGRMLRVHSPSPMLKDLIDSANDCISNHDQCIFQPLNNCLIGPGGELKATLSGHPQVVLGIKKSSCSPVIVSYSRADEGSLFQVWNIASLECVEVESTLRLPGKDVPGGNNFVVAGDCVAAINASSYMLWSMGTGIVLDQFDSDSEQLTCITSTHSGQHIIIGTSNGHALFKTISEYSGSKIGAVVSMKESILSLDVTLNDLTTVTVLANHTIALIDNTSRQVSKVVNASDFQSSSCTARHIVESSSGKILFVLGTESGSIHSVDLSTFSTKSIDAHTKTVKCITHVLASNAFITGSLDKTLKVWDVHSFSLLRVLTGHVDGVWCVHSLPGRPFIVSGSKDDYLKVWDVDSGGCLHTLEGHSSWIASACAVTSDIIASGSNDKNLKIWKLGSGTSTFDPSRRHLAQPECVGLYCDTFAASGGPDAMKVWNPLNGECCHSINSPTSCILFAPNALLVSGTKKGKIEVRDCSSNFSLLHSEQGHSDKVTKLLVLSNEHLVSASLDSAIIVWTQKLQKETVLKGHSRGVTSMAISGAQNVLASGSTDCNICLWDLQNFELLKTLTGHTKTINCLAFSPSDAVIVTGSDDRTARVWSTSSYSCLWIIEYTDSIKAISFIKEDVFLAGAHCGKKQLRSWSTKTGKCVGDFVGHTHAVMCMVVIGEHHVVTGSRDGTIRVWDSLSGSLLCSYDLQSQVKHISVSKLSVSRNYLLASTTKTGPIAFLKLCLV